MFLNADKLKAEILNLEPEDFFETYIAGTHTERFSPAKIDHFCGTFSENFDIEIKSNSIVIVGSAKIGFAIHEKSRRDDEPLPAWRSFGAESDIDLTICNPELFGKIWRELGAHACLQPNIPWNPKRLGEYLMYGWLRPDKFPKGEALALCDRFYRTVGELRRDRVRAHPKISVALFNSLEQLRRYQCRSIRISKEKLRAEQ